MGNEEPSGQQAVEHCPRCGSVVENAAGIGPFCPNAKCDVADNLLCVPTFSTTAPTAPSTAAGEREALSAPRAFETWDDMLEAGARAIMAVSYTHLRAHET